MKKAVSIAFINIVAYALRFMSIAARTSVAASSQFAQIVVAGKKLKQQIQNVRMTAIAHELADRYIAAPLHTATSACTFTYMCGQTSLSESVTAQRHRD